MTFKFSEAQEIFCKAPEGNIRLLAPAGCGKTICILHRCLHLANQTRRGHSKFLIVVFTRAAKDVLQDRINSDYQFKNIRDLTDIATLNSWGFRRIKKRAFHPKLIISKEQFHFTVLNQLQPVWKKHESVKDAIEGKKYVAPRKLMSVIDAFKSLGFDHQRHKDVKLFGQHIDYLKSQQLEWRLEDQYDELAKLQVLETVSNNGQFETPKAGKSIVYRAFFQFWRDAADRLISNDTFSLEDQKYFAYLDEQRKLEEGSYLSGAARYSEVFVDEFQDINPLDLNLIKAIVQRNRANLTVAGDDDQAIFEWRGATPEYILNPAKYFDTEFKTHILDVNYRSPKNIVTHSKKLIQNNLRRVEKDVKAYSETNAAIEVKSNNNLTDELESVYSVVNDSISKGNSPAQVAIIGRKRSQIIPYQIYFASKNIPFCAAEDLSVFLSKTFEELLELIEIKTGAMHTNRMSYVVKDIIKLTDCVKRYPLNRTEKNKLRSHMYEKRPKSVNDAICILNDYRGNLKGSNVDGRMSIIMADAIWNFVKAKSVSDTLQTLSQHFEGLKFDYSKAEDDIFYIDPPFLHLAEFAFSYGDNYEKFVQDLQRAKDQLVYTPPFSDEITSDSQIELHNRPVHLMTALRVKGKEFNTIVLLDVTEGIWPNKNAKSVENLEAERRVFYAAFTRAREHVLILTRNGLGSSGPAMSRYVDELHLPSSSLSGDNFGN